MIFYRNTSAFLITYLYLTDNTELKNQIFIMNCFLLRAILITIGFPFSQNGRITIVMKSIKMTNLSAEKNLERSLHLKKIARNNSVFSLIYLEEKDMIFVAFENKKTEDAWKKF